ncbi:hypothetical protein L3X07_13270 [Levilactobacillus brevis]|nr:hypothetical protein [Levilactobacillus brevis]
MTTSAADLPAVGQALTQWVTTHATTLPTLTALSIQAPQLVPTDLHDLETDWLALYQRTHARLLKEHQRYFIRLNVALPESPLTAPQLDQQYWEAGAPPSSHRKTCVIYLVSWLRSQPWPSGLSNHRRRLT